MAHYQGEGLIRMVAKICADWNVHAEIRMAGIHLSRFDNNGRFSECIVPWEVLYRSKNPDFVMLHYFSVMGVFGMVKVI